MSWTTDKGTAAWFANRFGGDPLVLKAEVRKADVLAHFAYESEVVVRPRRVSKVVEVPVAKASVPFSMRERLVA